MPWNSKRCAVGPRPSCVTRALGYDQKLRRLATLATESIDYPTLSDACQNALDKRVICDMYEGNAPYTPRYVLPDYERAVAQGSRHLELPAPRNLDDALSFLQIMYAHVPSVTTYPVYLGDLDKVLARFDGVERPSSSTGSLRRFWIALDRMLPDAFVHTDIGPSDSRIARSILRVERSLRQVVPNLTLKVDPRLTPDDLVLDAVRTVFETGKPHFVNHPMMVGDHGDEYAAVSCYNSLKIGGGAHTLVRLNLKEAALRHAGDADSFLAETLPAYVELTAELAEARVRSLVEQQHFFESSWLAQEGLDLDRSILGDVRRVRARRSREPARSPTKAAQAATATMRTPTRCRTASPSGSPNWSRHGPCPTARAVAAVATCIPRAASTSTATSPPALESPSATSRRCWSTSTPVRRTITCSRPGSVTSSTWTTPRCATRKRSSTSSAVPSSPACVTSPSTSTRTTSSASPATSSARAISTDIEQRGARHSSDYLAAGSEASFHLSSTSRETDRMQ